MYPSLSIVIPTYNRCIELKECLNSILSDSIYDRSIYHIEILVSDNASSDETQNILSQFQDDRLRWWSNSKNLGAQQNAYNLLCEASGDYIFLMTDDSVVLPDSFSRVFKIIHAFPNLGLIMSRMAYRHNITKDLLDYRSDFDRNQYFPPGYEGLVQLWMGTRVFPRLVINKKLMDLSWVIDNMSCIYPSMHFSCRPIINGGVYYSHEIMVINNFGNKNYWSYPSDFEVPYRLKIIRDVLPKSKEFVVRGKLVTRLLKEDMQWIMDDSKGHAVKQLIKIPEVCFNSSFWSLSVGWFVNRYYMKVKFSRLKSMACQLARKVSIRKRSE